MNKENKYLHRRFTALFIALAVILGTLGNTLAIEGAKKPSLHIRTTKFTRTNQNGKVKKKQTIRVKKLPARSKVAWKSSNKAIATVKAGKKGRATLSVSLKKAGSSTIKATIRSKETNRRITSLRQSIRVVNQSVATAKPTTPSSLPTAAPTPTPSVTASATLPPSVTPSAAPTKTPSSTPSVVPATRSPEPSVPATTAPTGTPSSTPSVVPTTNPPPTATPTIDPSHDLWVGTWGSSQYSISASDSRAPKLANSTFRQIIRLSTGGSTLRFTFSNEYGQTPMVINSVHIARPTENGKPHIDVATDTAVTFNGGSESVTIPARGRVTSDAVIYHSSPLEKIAVSTYFGTMPSTLTHHAASRSYSFLQAGDAVSAATMGTSAPVNWYALSNVDVLSPRKGRSIVCFGDSITDGYGTDASYLGQKPDSYLRWSDVLAQNLQGDADTQGLSVINMGIGANAIFGGQGPPAKDRFDRDVLQQPEVGYLVFLIGINDIGSANNMSLVDRITAEYATMIEKARAQGIYVFAGTLTPTYGNADYYSTTKESIRQAVNAWLRQQYADGEIDGLLDFDALLKDPAAEPPRLLAKYNADGLHPNVTGYQAMGEAVYEAISDHVKEHPLEDKVPEPSNEPTPPPALPTIPPELADLRPPAEDLDGYEEVDLSAVEASGGESGNTLFEDNVGVYFYDVDSLNVPLKQTLKSGDKVHVVVQGRYDDGEGFRSFLSTEGRTWASTTIAYGAMPDGANPAESTLTDTDYGFKWEFSQEANNGAPQLLFKGHAGGANLTGTLMIYRIYIKYEIS